MVKKQVALLFLFLSFSLFGICQDTLRLLDGHVLEVKIKKISELEISYLRLKKNKELPGLLDREEVFSYKKKGEEEVQVYRYNPEIGNIYNLQEMKDYMVGEQHAREHYRPLVSNLIAFSAGVWSGSAIADGNHIFVASPLVFSSLLMIGGTRVKKGEYNENYLKNNAYRDGYKRVAKGKKFFDAFKFSALGMLGSFIIFEATD